MKVITLTITSVILLAALVAPATAAKRYYIKATAVCTDCGDLTPVPLQTTGKGFASKAACEKGRREMIAIGKNNRLKITAQCKVK
jgi:hypothetical protein